MEEVKVKPILFNTEMVLAILEGRKTVTRRIVKLPKYIHEQGNGLYVLHAENACYVNQKMQNLTSYLKMPYQPNDILYVRETWADGYDGYVYKADDKLEWKVVKWHPSIHMPKEAARIWLKVTNVRIERLQDIDIAGCEKEGCQCGHNGDIFEFMSIWDSTIKKPELGKYGWETNPWVWVIEFERCDRPQMKPVGVYADQDGLLPAT